MERGKKIWGKSWWDVLHSAAATFTPTSAKIEAYDNLVKAYAVLLPCDRCQGHFKEFLSDVPVRSYMEDNQQLFFWSYIAHDRANQIHNQDHPNGILKTSPGLPFIRDFWFKGLGQRCDNCGQ